MRNRIVPPRGIELLENRRLLSAGDLDPTYGTGGKASLPYVGSADDYAKALVMYPDGSFVVGVNRFAAGEVGKLVKYLPDGRLDESFGVGGVSRSDLPYGTGLDQMLLNDDGTFLGTGTVPSTAPASTPRVMRFLPDGEPDPTWVGPGPHGGITGLNRDLVAAPGGKSVYIAGLTVARLNPNGSLDSTFGSGGRLTFTGVPGQPRFAPNGAAVQSDGSIVMAGESAMLDAGTRRAAVRRYLPNGTLDTTFGSGGTTLLPTSTTQSVLHDVQLLSDGRVAVVGRDANQSVAAVLRPNGTLDPTFGTGGVVRWDVGSDASDEFTELWVQPDGNLLIRGVDQGTQTRMGGVFLARLTPEGSIDWNFAGDGMLERIIPEPALVFSGADVAFQPDGRIILASGTYMTSNSDVDVVVTRLTPDGWTDTTFGPDGTGIVATDLLGPHLLNVAGSALQADGKVVFTGSSRIIAGDLPVGRLNADGTPDATFGDGTAGPAGDAVAVFDFGARTEWGQDVLALPDGKTLVFGRHDAYQWLTGWDDQYLLARLNPDGTLDSTFGDGGKALTDFNGLFQLFHRGGLDANGNILAQGIFQTQGFRGPTVVRYTPDGQLDWSFGDGGRILIDLPGVQEELVRDFIVLPDGAMLLAGTAETPRTTGDPNGDRFVLRLNPDGTFDTSFGGGDGFVLLDSGSLYEGSNSLQLAPGGQMYLVGEQTNASTTTRHATLTRLNADGSTDASFGTGGTVLHALSSARDATVKMVRDAEGRFVFAGTRTVGSGSTSSSDFMAIRLDPTGAPDLSFGPAGMRTYDLGTRSDSATDMHLAADGKIVITGRLETGSGTHWAAVRVEDDSPPASRVAGRHVFYNRSAFDNNDPAANAADDAAVAADKAALLPGEGVTAGNYTSYSRGINGVMVDLAGLPAGATPSASDFTLEMRSGGGAWAPVSATPAVAVRRGAGVGGSDRVTLTLPDGAVRNGWLRVMVKPGPDTGLASPDVFHFGNLVGDAADAAAGAARAVVNAIDSLRARRALSAVAPVTSRYDFNRDGRVSAIDLGIIRAALGRWLTLSAAPQAAPVPPASASSAPSGAEGEDEQDMLLA